MNVYNAKNIGEILKNNSYPGRGIIVGMSSDKRKAVFAYFIMGRSENSRNRIFVKTNDGIMIKPFDLSKVKDPSLIIYSPVRRFKDKIVVTNGDQTDTIIDFFKEQKSFESALETRSFEPDAPNFTPRISAALDLNGGYTYKISILKSADESGTDCNRFTFSYSPSAGIGHFIHTYSGDGSPLPSFTGEPERVNIPAGIEEFAGEIWENSDTNNKISLYVEYINLLTGETESIIKNSNIKEKA